MAKRKKHHEISPREWRDRFCATEGHPAAPVVIKGRATVLCLECDDYLAYRTALGRTPANIAEAHFTKN